MIQMGHPYIAHSPGDIFVRPKRVDNNIEFRTAKDLGYIPRYMDTPTTQTMQLRDIREAIADALDMTSMEIFKILYDKEK